jgi:hypothetical protein
VPAVLVGLELGVPLITPVVVFKEIPTGSAYPEATDQKIALNVSVTEKLVAVAVAALLNTTVVEEMESTVVSLGMPVPVTDIPTLRLEAEETVIVALVLVVFAVVVIVEVTSVTAASVMEGDIAAPRA